MSSEGHCRPRTGSPVDDLESVPQGKDSEGDRRLVADLESVMRVNDSKKGAQLVYSGCFFKYSDLLNGCPHGGPKCPKKDRV